MKLKTNFIKLIGINGFLALVRVFNLIRTLGTNLYVIVGNFPSDVLIVHFIKRFPNGPKRDRKPHVNSIYYIYLCILRFYPIFFYEQWEGPWPIVFTFYAVPFFFLFFITSLQFNLFILAAKTKLQKKKKTLGYRFFFFFGLLRYRATDGRKTKHTSRPTVSYTIDVNLGLILYSPAV